MVTDLGAAGTQSQLAALVGVSQQAISAAGIQPGMLGEMLLAYCARLRETAAGRLSEVGALAKSIEVMVSELDQIDGLLAQTCPDLPEGSRQAVLSCVASARNKIAQRGASLVMAAIDPGDDIDAEDESTPPA